MNPHPTDNDNCLLWERNFDKSYGETEELIHSLKDEAKKQECDSPYSVDSVMKEASKIIDSQVDRMRNDLKAKESLIQSMREQVGCELNYCIFYKNDCICIDFQEISRPSAAIKPPKGTSGNRQQAPEAEAPGSTEN